MTTPKMAISLAVSPEVHAWLVEQAETQETSKGSIIRQAIARMRSGKIAAPAKKQSERERVESFHDELIAGKPIEIDSSELHKRMGRQ